MPHTLSDMLQTELGWPVTTLIIIMSYLLELS